MTSEGMSPLEIMNVQATISDFITTVMEMLNDAGTFSERDIKVLDAMLQVAKTVHVAQMQIQSLMDPTQFGQSESG